MLTSAGGKAYLFFLGILFLALAVPHAQAETIRNIQADSESYVIGKGDVLEIVIWQEPDLSREVKVRVDGRISMPLVDDVMAAGKTPMDLKQTVTGRLSRFIQDPEVTVIVRNQISKSYYVLGEVRQVGEFALEKDLTLMQAITRAQGFTEWANKRNLVLFRQSGDSEERIDINYRDIVSGSAPEQNLRIQPGDTLVVPH
ncbi:polysaccharide biosynthesis/export family protein [Desulfonatronospira sp.]|uniref:polysaccharide biosynthesis/export family protein n=1 Tax=Desulfonatronospira sp. TaxID=1962951 RepID=UPI0025B8810B|nr:polysaccharide biosynthesis/export family protein [Desulfonatronospira sp.]